MRVWKMALYSLAALALGAGLSAQDAVSDLQDVIGARGAAIDGLDDRGYSYVRGEKAGDSAFTYWTENRTQRCVIARVTDGKVASVVYAPSSDCGTEAKEGGAEEKFNTVCGVIVDGKTHRYRCEVVETTTSEGKRVTVLRYPDIEMKLHWHRENNVGVSIEGTKNVRATYSAYEGETNFVMDGKTYFYISNNRAAKLELENFKD